jgi:hypothetical protein
VVLEVRRFVGIRCLLVKMTRSASCSAGSVRPCHAGSAGFLPLAVSDVERS